MSTKVEIRRFQYGECYPRSGNFGNPTPRYRWDVYVNGRFVVSQPRRRDAKRFANEYVEEIAAEQEAQAREAARDAAEAAYRGLKKIEEMRWSGQLLVTGDQRRELRSAIAAAGALWELLKKHVERPALYSDDVIPAELPGASS